jgi:hypothetical protein
MASAAALLAACGGKQTPALAANASTGLVQATGDCTSALPVTGLCQEAGIGVFGKISPTAELLAPGCVWKTMEAQRSPDEVLVFRGQDCTAGRSDTIRFRFITPRELHLLMSGPDFPESDEMVATILDVPAGKTAEEVAATTLAVLPEKERATCAPQPQGTASDDKPVAGRAFQLQPDEATLAALRKEAAGDIISTCGRYGYTEDFQELWEGRTRYAIYHALGQDTGPWDPMSFTFYRKDAGGAWVKQTN